MRCITLDELDTYETGEPVLVKRAITASRAFADWRPETLRRDYGALVCAISDDSRPGNNAKPRRYQQPLRDYIDGLEHDPGDGRGPYLFHTFREASDPLADELVTDVMELLDLMGFEHQLFRFYMGPTLSGALPHAHGSAANALVWGRKRWTIYIGRDPERHRQLVEAAYRDYPVGSFAVDWFERAPAELARKDVVMWECIQEAGDVVAFPAGALHAVINLAPVIGLVTEETEQ